MRSFTFYPIEERNLNKMLQFFWSHLDHPVKGFRSKTFPALLTGIPQGYIAKC
jgi:hypothetical protein